MQLFFSNPFYPTLTAAELWNAPLPVPEVIKNVPIEFSMGTIFCVDIDTFRLWEVSDTDVYSAVSRSVILTIDGNLIPRRDFDVSAVAIALNRYDDEGNVIGSHRGPISACVDDLRVEIGLHVATISFESSTGTDYVHQWAFQVLR